MLLGLSKGGVPCPHFSSVGSTTPHSPHWDHVLAGSEMPQRRLLWAGLGACRMRPPQPLSGLPILHGAGEKQAPACAAGRGLFKYRRHFPHLRREPVLPISHEGSLPTAQL